MKFEVRTWIALSALAITAGCNDAHEERCRAAQRASASAWQAYESSAREGVNRADDEATAAGRTSAAAGARAQVSADDAAQRLTLADLVPDLPPPDADAGTAPTPPAAPPTVHPAGAPGVAPTAVDPARRAQLIAARNLALNEVDTVRDVANAARDLGGSITSRDNDGAQTAITRASDGAHRAQAAAARIAQTVAGAAGTDPLSQALSRVNETAQSLALSANTTLQSMQAAVTALEHAQAALERANAALTASGAAFRNAVMARNAAHAVPDDPAQPLLVRARAASDEAWGSCSSH